MRRISLIFVMLLCCTPIYAANLPYIYYFSESRTTDPVTDVGTTTVTGVGMEWYGQQPKGQLFAGVSGGVMESDQTVSSFGDPKLAYPLFAYGGVGFNSHITPFIEFGVDLLTAIFHDTVENEEAPNYDHFFSGGIMIRNKHLLIKIYARQYSMSLLLLPPTDVYVVGASLGLRF
ncbi:MAG: hypothetical protein OEZ39_19075 [Gammaproteobacteria bacterium]|nr:hypothetical protein [Gammaproteobacteria bacterium]MDH5653968.1 hypothetical protein [Gammaproteobacteria bacterium]